MSCAARLASGWAVEILAHGPTGFISYIDASWIAGSIRKGKTLWGDRGKGGTGLSDDIRRERNIADITAKALSFVQAPSK